MNYFDYVPYVEPVRREPSLLFSIWYRFKTIGDTINHNAFIRKSKKTKKETVKIVNSANIIGMDIEEARKKIPSITIRDYGIDQTQAHCSRRCNVYVDENNIITRIVNFG